MAAMTFTLMATENDDIYYLGYITSKRRYGASTFRDESQDLNAWNGQVEGVSWRFVFPSWHFVVWWNSHFLILCCKLIISLSFVSTLCFASCMASIYLFVISCYPNPFPPPLTLYFSEYFYLWRRELKGCRGFATLPFGLFLGEHYRSLLLVCLVIYGRRELIYAFVGCRVDHWTGLDG
jgi:hypothetical protein